MNPYVESPGPFVGRTDELAQLRTSLTRGRSALAAIMAGRGMGKTSFARALTIALESAGLDLEVISWASTPTHEDLFYKKLSASLDYPFTGELFDDELREAIEARERLRTILIFDEVDALIDSPQGRAVFEGLRIAWEQLAGRLGVVILGGSRLWELLRSKVSPFLGRATFVRLRGLSPDETKQLVLEPSGLDIPDAEIELLWQETAGHPAVVTEIMTTVVDRGLASILPAIDAELSRTLETKYFPTWWDNLRAEGQALYRRLVEYGRPVPRNHVPALLRGPAAEWIQVLETTGVALLENAELLPRGELFGRWARHEHFFESTPPPTPGMPAHLSVALGSASNFERALCLAVRRWSAGVIEYAGLGLLLKPESEPGNKRLLPEAHFQLSLLLALQQQGWHVEAEGWSGGGRTDLKVMQRREDGERATVELKIWGRNDYAQSTDQVLGYAQPNDAFAAVVMIDRQQQPLPARYRKLIDGLGYTIVACSTDMPGQAPQLVTEHPRVTGRSVRVHHYLVQLPSD
jgi:hypothetical protein